MGYKKILVAVDGSESSRNAFRQACKVARHDKSWVTAITTVPPYQDLFQVPSRREKVVAMLKSEAQKVVDEVKAVAKEEDIFLNTVVEEGAPAEAIVSFAEESNFDLIAMGRRGRGEVERALVGSVTARVIGNAPCDVLVVPKGAKMGWQNLLFSTDGSLFSEAALGRAIEFARSFGSSSLAVLSVAVINEELFAQAPDLADEFVRKAMDFSERAKARVEAEGLSAEAFVREGAAHEKIIELAWS